MATMMMSTTRTAVHAAAVAVAAAARGGCCCGGSSGLCVIGPSVREALACGPSSSGRIFMSTTSAGAVNVATAPTPGRRKERPPFMRIEDAIDKVKGDAR